MLSPRQELLRLLATKSFRLGQFKLASGGTSDYYIDCRTTTLDARGAQLTGQVFLDEIRARGWNARAIGGLTMGADPIATAVAVVSAVEGRPLPAFIVRKEAKGHGAQRTIEGWDGKTGARVIIVDDVCTTGGSMLAAADRAEEAGYTVAAVFCVVDREEGGTELIAKRYPFYPLFTAKELMKDA